MKKKAFIFGVIASLGLLCLAYPISSQVASRHSSFVGVEGGGIPTPYDYVQDGLVALYDGDWNVGVDSHDPDSDAWIDLTGNGRTLTVIWGDIGWDDKCFISCHGTIGNANIGLPVNDGKSDRTVEIVSSGARNGAQRCHLTIHSGNSSSVWGLGHYMWGDIRAVCGYSFSGSNVSIANFPNIQDILLSKSVRLRGNECVFIVNDDMKTSSSRMNYTSNGLFLGNTALESSYTDEVRIYSVRIYDRVLSDEEVSYNFAIDRARFGL